MESQKPEEKNAQEAESDVLEEIGKWEDERRMPSSAQVEMGDILTMRGRDRQQEIPELKHSKCAQSDEMGVSKNEQRSERIKVKKMME